MILNFLRKEQEKRNNKIVRNFFSDTVKSLELLLSASDKTLKSIELDLNEKMNKNDRLAETSLSSLNANLKTIDIVWDALNQNVKKYKKIASDERLVFEGDSPDNDYNKVIEKLKQIEDKMIDLSKVAGRISTFIERK